MIYESEADVRKTIDEWFNKQAFWIEHSIGGTLGMPDVLLLDRCMLLPLELKCQEGINKDKPPTLRPAQRKVINDLVNAGCPAGVLAAKRGTSQLFFYPGFLFTYNNTDSHNGVQTVIITNRKNLLIALRGQCLTQFSSEST